MAGITERPPPPPFTGFSADTFAFLRELAVRQDREWMTANKAVFERDVREPLASLVADVAAELAEAGSLLRGDPKRSLFRIHRDTRFSRDKRPFKTNVGATLTRDGGKLSPGLLYIHIDPAGCFVAAGFYHPETAHLDRLRRGLVDQPRRWRETRDRLAAAGLSLSRNDALARRPRGFEHVTDPEDVDVLKLKSWIVSAPIDESDTLGRELVTRIVGFATDATPLLDYGWSALAG
jgi:uncharacterized protein (TIGR02453 family)